MAQGLDHKFLHYGIREEDLSLIKSLCLGEMIRKFVLKEKVIWNTMPRTR